MIAAANADGVIDQTERDNILGRLQAVDLSPEEHAFIAQELLAPADLDAGERSELEGSLNEYRSAAASNDVRDDR